MAYELQSAKERQKIRAEEIEIDVVERKKLIDIEEKEILRKEKELIATVKRPAEAQAYKLETLAEGQRSVCKRRLFVKNVVSQMKSLESSNLLAYIKSSVIICFAEKC